MRKGKGKRRCPGPTRSANIGERNTWTQSEFCTWQNSVRLGKCPRKCIHSVTAQDTAKHGAFWLTSVERRRCSNEVNTWNPLKFAGVPQTGRPISAANGLKFTILWGHVEEKLLFNKFVSDCRYVPSLGRYSPTNLCDGAQMTNFWRFFASCIFSESRAAHLRPAF